MKLVLIEDDSATCERFRNIEKYRDDIEFVGVTSSAEKGISLVKQYVPDGIILDLELSDGKGNGFDFLNELKKLNFSKMPKVVVTTNVYSDSVYDYLHLNKVDFVFYKKQEGYSESNVISTLLLLNGIENDNGTLPVEENIAEEKAKAEKLSRMIDEELNLIGIGSHLQGRKYLHDAIEYTINTEDDSKKVSVTQYLSKLYKRPSSTISRAMQNAILYAWRISSIEDLQTYYTARVNYDTGVPTPMEFVYYYADKIKKKL